MKSFEYFQDTKIIFGSGKVSMVGEVVKQYGTRCLLVTTKAVDPLNIMFDKVKTILKNSGIEVAHFEGVQPNPTTSDIAQGAELARSIDAEVILGLGGGSSMDAAKAIAVEASHEGSCWDYLFYKEQPTKKTLPIIAVSSTSGTGSQVTQVSVVTNTEERDKSALYNSLLYPRVAIVDPELMITLPQFVTACTGFDVFCHAFESLTHPNAGAFIDSLGRQAISLVSEYLPKVLSEPGNVEFRSYMAWADTLAGLCIANAGVTLPHGMGMAIGGMYPHVAHGQALALVYRACTEFTWRDDLENYSYMAKVLDPNLQGLSIEETACQSEHVIWSFLKKIGMDQKLKNVGMPENEIEALADQSMVLPDYKNNPRLASRDEMIELVKKSYY